MSTALALREAAVQDGVADIRSDTVDVGRPGVVHLRPQIDLLRSNASQRARSHPMGTRDDITRPALGPGKTPFHYNATLGRWEDVLSRLLSRRRR